MFTRLKNTDIDTTVVCNFLIEAARGRGHAKPSY